MKSLFLFFSFLLCSKYFYGQNCNIADLPEPDKAALQSFWNDFRESVNTHDTLKLLSLCELPFPCTYCARTKIKSAAVLLKSMFFFTTEFIEEMNTHDTPEGYFILHGATLQGGRVNCSYVFPIVLKKYATLYFDVNKIRGAYKINSAWTRD